MRIGSLEIALLADTTAFKNQLRLLRASSALQGRAAGNAFARAFKKEMDSVGVATRAILGAVTGLVKKFTLLGPVAAGGLNVLAGAATALAGSLYNAGISLGAFAGVFGALALAGATAFVAFKGFGEALKGNADALAKLSPNAREAAEGLRSFKDEASGVRQAVQDKFFEGMAGPLKELAGNYLPLAKDEMSKMAGVLNVLNKDLIAWANSGETVAGVKDLFSGFSGVMGELGKAVKPALQGMLDLLRAIMPSAQGLGTSITGLAEKFAAWAKAGRESGSIAETMERAMASGRLLFSVLGNLAGIINNVFKGASGAGDGLLFKLDAILEKFRAWTGSIEGQASIGQWATQGAEALGKVFEVVGALSPVFKELAKPELFNALIGIIGSVASTLSTIMPYVSPIIAGFAQLLVTLTPILGPLIGIALAARSLFFVVGIVMKIASMFKVLGSVIRGVTMVWRLLSLAFAMSPIGFLITAIVALVAGLIYFFTQTEKGKEIWNAIWENIKTILEQAGEFFSKAWEKIKEIFSAAWDFVKEWGMKILDLITLPWRVAFGIVWAIIEGAWTAIKAIFNAVKDYFIGLWDWIVNLFKGAWTAIKEAVNGGIGGVFDLVKSLPGRIMEALGDLNNLLFDAGKNVIQGLIDGIKKMISGVGDVMGDIADTITSFWPFSPAKQGPLRVHPPEEAGEHINELFAKGLTKTRPISEALANSMMLPAARGAVAGPSSLDRSFHVSIGQVNGSRDPSRTAQEVIMGIRERAYLAAMAS